MKPFDKSAHAPRGLRHLLRPGPRPWFRRPDPSGDDADRPGPAAAVSGAGPGADPAATADADVLERLVSLYGRLLSLRDRAMAETHVGEDALSVGDGTKASQHFAFGDHYRSRARDLERTIERHVASLGRAAEEGAGLARSALRLARERRYGSDALDERPPFA